MPEFVDPTWLVDTSILVDLLRGSQTAVAWLGEAVVARAAVSLVTQAELLQGCRDSNEQRLVTAELARYQLLPLDAPISCLAIELLKSRHLSHRVGFLDCLIAATALTHDLTVATLNVRHFGPLPGVRVIRPY